mmetsp:Transcript_22026/g.74075  ORF Transcript_22026/g.74075 Transcript_22026/m.74075 type:complete len:439 (+) Transcript_22026:276-1592(+)
MEAQKIDSARLICATAPRCPRWRRSPLTSRRRGTPHGARAFRGAGSVGPAPQDPALCRLATHEALGALRERRLVVRDAERLCGEAGGGAHVLARLALARQGLLLGHVLDLVLPLLLVAEGRAHHVGPVQRRDEVFPLGHVDDARVALGGGAREQVVLHLHQAEGHLLQERGQRDGHLGGRVVAAHEGHLLGREVPGADLHAERHPLELPVRVLAARGVVGAQVRLAPDAGALQLGGHILGARVHGGLIHVLARDGDDHHLHRRDARREHEALVVRVDHDHHADGARGEPPGVLPRYGLLLVSGGVLDVEDLSEVLPEAVRGGALDAAARVRDEALHGRGVVAPGKLLLLRLAPLDHRHGEEVLVHLPVEVEHLEHLLLGVRFGRVRRVTLLPEELPRPEEGGRVLELPADHVVPLVELEREVPVGPDPLGVGRVHDRL